jgi:outer membrane immunogenic protein
MKRILIAGALALVAGGTALAADLPQVPAPLPAFSWTGIYLGPNGGYGFGTSNWTAPPPTGSTGNFTTSGELFGLTFGGN